MWRKTLIIILLGACVMSVFNKAFAFTVKEEGGYVNNPNDRGGETKYGISKRAYPDLDIKNLTLAKARNTYYMDYWLVGKCDLLPSKLALVHFDATVNHGPYNAARILQRAVGAVDDGIIGPNTLKRIRLMNQEELVLEYLAERIKFYNMIVSFDSSQKEFYDGWIKRTFKLYRFVGGGQ